jgi:hypothetical protein
LLDDVEIFQIVVPMASEKERDRQRGAIQRRHFTIE